MNRIYSHFLDMVETMRRRAVTAGDWEKRDVDIKRDWKCRKGETVAVLSIGKVAGGYGLYLATPRGLKKYDLAFKDATEAKQAADRLFEEYKAKG